MPPGESDCGGFPCIFPADQGFRQRDGFAIDCPHRQLVRNFGEFWAAARAGAEITRHSAGFWASASACPHRRDLDDARDRAAAVDFLYCRLWRFGFVPPLLIRMRFPARRQNFPCFRIQGNTPLRTPRRGRTGESGPTRKPVSGEFPVSSLRIRDFSSTSRRAAPSTHKVGSSRKPGPTRRTA